MLPEPPAAASALTRGFCEAQEVQSGCVHASARQGVCAAGTQPALWPVYRNCDLETALHTHLQYRQHQCINDLHGKLTCAQRLSMLFNTFHAVARNFRNDLAKPFVVASVEAQILEGSVLSMLVKSLARQCCMWNGPGFSSSALTPSMRAVLASTQGQ